MPENKLKQARPSSTLESYEPKSPSQEKALETMTRLAQAVESIHEKFRPGEFPFKHAKLVILTGETGRGKTHLVEGFINYLKEHAPEAYSGTFLARSQFNLDNIACACDYDRKPILILDDMYSERQTIEDMTIHEIQRFMAFIMKIYEERRLVIITTNFPILTGLLQLVRKYDTQGRVISRFDELVSHSLGELIIDGPDGRAALHARPNDNPFDL